MSFLITILGPTATGKTTLAASLAATISGEVISADSRQVYRGMDLGTGKDLEDYIVEGKQIPFHLIDIAEPGEEYNVFRFQRDFLKAYSAIQDNGKKAVMCGGTGMYLESVIFGYDMKKVDENSRLRTELEAMSDKELQDRLASLRDLHNVTDTSDRERMMRAIEIAEVSHQNPDIKRKLDQIDHKIFGILLPREEIRKRITKRLEQRLQDGMVEEVRTLLQKGIHPDQLEFYGLEYRYLTQYVGGQINYNDMFQRLNSAIHQFAKRQMTWFRRMEKKGADIVWVDGTLPLDEKLGFVMKEIDYLIS
jgi:tRNA dimethylallyltransferase